MHGLVEPRERGPGVGAHHHADPRLAEPRRVLLAGGERDGALADAHLAAGRLALERPIARGQRGRREDTLVGELPG